MFVERILPKDDAIAFAQNMRWFADVGRISYKKIAPDKVRVKATPAAWSYWKSSHKYEVVS